MTKEDKELLIDERINREIDSEWLKKMIKQIYYLEKRKHLSSGQVDEIVRGLYFDLLKDEQDNKAYSDLQKVEIVKNKIVEYIKLYERKVNKRELIINKYKQRVIALSTLLSLLIAIPTAMITKSKRDNREVLYKTKSIECSFDANGENGYQYEQNIYTYHTGYQPMNPLVDMVKIIDDEAWKIEGIEARKKVKTYSLFNVNYDEIANSGNIDKYLVGIIPTEEVKYVYQNMLKDEAKEQGRVYHIVREIQDLTDQIVVQHKSSDMVKTVIVLLAELLLLSYIIDCNEALMSQEIMGLIGQIMANRNLCKEEKKILEELRNKYQQISYLALTVREEDKKRIRAK